MSYAPFLNSIEIQSPQPTTIRFSSSHVDPQASAFMYSSSGLSSTSPAGGVLPGVLANQAAAFNGPAALSSTVAPAPNHLMHYRQAPSTALPSSSLPPSRVAQSPGSNPRLRLQQQHHPSEQIRGEELNEDSKAIRLSIDLPGVRMKDLRVQFRSGVLEVKAVRRVMSMDGVSCLKKQKISRQYAIDCSIVDVSKIRADLDHGVLVITAPKGKRQPYKSEINNSSKSNVKGSANERVEDHGVAISP